MKHLSSAHRYQQEYTSYVSTSPYASVSASVCSCKAFLGPLVYNFDSDMKQYIYMYIILKQSIQITRQSHTHTRNYLKSPPAL